MKALDKLHFFGTAHAVFESKIESRMIACMRDVVLEFGNGFSFMRLGAGRVKWSKRNSRCEIYLSPNKRPHLLLQRMNACCESMSLK